MKRWVCAVALALLLAPSAGAADKPAPLIPTGRDRSVEQPFVPATGGPRLTESIVVARFLEDTKVANWLDRYPPHPPTDATFDRANRRWTVKVWSG